MVEMMAPRIVTVEEAGTRLRELIGLAEQGEEVVIAYEDQPKVKLVPVRPVPQKRVFGQHRGRSGYARTLMLRCRRASGSVGRHEAAARYSYLPVVGWQPGTALSRRLGSM
jgi:antitoxin (DNA-binding transcriptional repressor) of toxin-antitoxin stability system